MITQNFFIIPAQISSWHFDTVTESFLWRLLRLSTAAVSQHFVTQLPPNKSQVTPTWTALTAVQGGQWHPRTCSEWQQLDNSLSAFRGLLLFCRNINGSQHSNEKILINIHFLFKVHYNALQTTLSSCKSFCLLFILILNRKRKHFSGSTSKNIQQTVMQPITVKIF